MTILHVTRDYPPRSKGGISTAVHGLVEALHAVGIPNAVVSFDGWRPLARQADVLPPTMEADSITPILRLISPAQTRPAETIIQSLRPTHIHVHDVMLWAFGAGLARRLKLPALLSLHVIQAESRRLLGVNEPTLSLNAEKRAVNEAAVVHVPTQAAHECLTRHYPSIGDKSIVIPFGIHPPHPATVHVPEGHPLVLYAGRFSELKGLPVLFAALPLVFERLPGSRLILAGGIPDNARSDRRWRHRLMASLSDHFHSRITFAGWLSPEELAGLMKTCTMLVSPSLVETMGLTVIEAMHQGLPVVAARIPAMEEIITHEETGLLVPPRDPAALADAVVRLAQDDLLRQRLVGQGSALIENRYLWPRLIRSFVQLYG